MVVINGMEPRVVIIGAGVCGLAAARQLRSRGIPFLVIDERNTPGGRLQTHETDGFLLDEGFQILNTAYPEFGRQEIDINSLGLQNFESGARIFINGKSTTLADPDRVKGYMLDALFTPAASWRDLFRVRALKTEWTGRAPEEIFSMQADSTMNYLKKKGFSTRIITRFLQPFYSGIFLEPDLKTEASMFAFVFSMFAHGHAALPQRGIRALPDLMMKDIPADAVWNNVSVAHAEPGRLLLADGRELNVPYVLMATGTRKFKPVHREAWKGNRGTTVLYFTIGDDPGLGRFIGLNGSGSGKINNFCMPSNVQPAYAPAGKRLLSISLKPGVPANEGTDQVVMDEFRILTGFHGEADFLHSYHVPDALPDIQQLRYEPEIIPVYEGAWASGDFAAYPSLNAALRAGYLLASQIPGQGS